MDSSNFINQQILLKKKPADDIVSSITGWWNEGGIAPSDVYSVWQPKGAVDYAASKVNISSPGTYDGIEVTPPTTSLDWDASRGWYYSADGKYLKTTLIPQKASSYIFKWGYAPATTNKSPWGSTTAGNANYWFVPRNSATSYQINNWNGSSGIITATVGGGGVLACNQTQYYLDGVLIGDLAAQTDTALVDALWLMCANSAGNPAFYFRGDFHALAVYKTNIPEAQLIAAMNACATDV